MATYAQAVELHARERAALREVEPYTARKARQKAMKLAPYIGDVQVEEIDPAAVRAALVELAESGNEVTGGPLSQATVAAALKAAKQACRWAVECGVAQSSPLDRVKSIRPRYRRASFLDPEGARRLASAALSEMADATGRERRFLFAAVAAIETGLRRGELFALRWTDFDFERGRLHVERAVKQGGDVGAPKSSSGVRSVAMGRAFAQIAQRERDATGGDGPLLGLSLNAFEHWWRGWADTRGFEGLRFHELRHSHATLLIAGGADVKTVQARMGHASADITMNVYAHALPNADADAADALDAMLTGGI